MRPNRLMAILPVLALTLPLGLAGPAMAEEPAPLLSVNGEGQVAATPDMATLNIGVTNTAETAKAALDANNESVRLIFEALAKAGVAEKDVQTSGLTLGPRYDGRYDSSSGAEPKSVGFDANNMVTVQVRDMAKVGPVIDALVGQGANVLNGVTFGLQDPAPVLDEARKAAVADARHRAELLAEAAGMKLGPLQSLTESGGAGPIMPMAQASFAKDGGVPVAGGQMAVSAYVSLVYRLVE